MQCEKGGIDPALTQGSAITINGGNRSQYNGKTINGIWKTCKVTVR